MRANHVRMRITWLTCGQQRNLLPAAIEDQVVGQQDVGASGLYDIAEAHGRIDVELHVVGRRSVCNGSATPEGRDMFDAIVRYFAPA